MSGRPWSLLELRSDATGVFRTRLNRFLGVAVVTHENGCRSEEYVHIHDPGRLTELLWQGNRLLLKRAPDPRRRKTAWDLVAASHDDQWILIHAGYHRRIAENLLNHPTRSPLGSFTSLRAEVTHGRSRLDFLASRGDGTRMLIEVKGCTLSVGGTALFPDAPTKRGVRHVETLMKARQEGFEASILILILRPDAERFAPHDQTDPDFAAAFNRALHAGVVAVPLVLSYDGSRVRLLRRIPCVSA